MRATLYAAVSSLALLAAPALAAGTQSQAAGGGTADSRPGASGQPSGGAMEQQIHAALEAEGFTDIGEVTREGDLYRVEATKDGQVMTLLIDPATGTAEVVE